VNDREVRMLEEREDSFASQKEGEGCEDQEKSTRRGKRADGAVLKLVI